MVDARKNFALATVAVAPSPAATGLALALGAGQGALMPTPPFNATCWPAGVVPLVGNAEIVRVESITGDRVALSGRGQEGTSAQMIEAGWQFANMLTAKTISDLQALAEAGGFVHVQAEASGVWTFEHPLGHLPASVALY